MDKMKAIDKIEKLLSLATSNNENEAQSALLMARKLMAQYKINEADLKERGPGKLNHVIYDRYSFSNVKNFWMLALAHVIANNHCCGFVCNRENSKTTVYWVKFSGLDDDPQIAMVIFDYAVEHIVSKINERRNELAAMMLDVRSRNQAIKMFADSYALGFAAGLKQKYDEQNAEECTETALVLVKPKEVGDYMDSLKSHKFRPANNGHDYDAERRGYQAGYQFNPTKQINAQ